MWRVLRTWEIAVIAGKRRVAEGFLTPRQLATGVGTNRSIGKATEYVRFIFIKQRTEDRGQRTEDRGQRTEG